MSNILEMAVVGKYACWHVGGDRYKLVTYGRYSQRVNKALGSTYPITIISEDSEPVFTVSSEQLKAILKQVFRDRRFLEGG